MQKEKLQNHMREETLSKKSLTVDGTMKEFLLSKEAPSAGVCLKGPQIAESVGDVVTVACQGRFKKEEIAVLFILDEEKLGKSGIAFTGKAIYHWTKEEGFIAEIFYKEIEAVGPVDVWLIFTLSEENHIPVFCGEDAEKQSYAPKLFLYLIDILTFYDRL